LTIVDYLLANGADVNAVDRCGNSPLESALSMGRTDVARFLTEKGGKIIRGSEEQCPRRR
jgi:ankyrin repeat protein